MQDGDADSNSEEEILKKIEAIMFVAGRFLDIKELISLSDLNPITIRETIEKLTSDYANRDTALQIIKKNEMWKMDVKPGYAKIGSSEFSKAEQETLAMIAFKQPAKQSVIIKIRGNKAYDHIKRFFELGLIRKKKTGHTYELSISEEFYDYFTFQGENLVQESLKANSSE